MNIKEYDDEEEDSEAEAAVKADKAGKTKAAKKERVSLYGPSATMGKGGQRGLKRADNRYKEIKRQLARRARLRKEDKSLIEE